MDPDHRLLRAFVTVAEEGHFGHAAEVLAIAQPALSKRIARLESQVGGRLFERTSRRIELTAAGRVLLPEARAALEQAQAALERARRVARGDVGTLRVGFMPGAIQPRVLRAFERRFPEVTVALRRYEWFDQTSCLHDGRADVAFVCPPVDDSGIHVEVIAEEPRLAVVAPEHPLSGRSAVSILDLGDDPVIGYHQAPPEWTAFSAVDPRPDGSAALYGPSVDTVEEKLEHAAAGRGICLVPASIHAYYARADLAFVPVTDVPPCKAALACPAVEPAPLAAELIETARSVA